MRARSTSGTSNMGINSICSEPRQREESAARAEEHRAQETGLVFESTRPAAGQGDEEERERLGEQIALVKEKKLG
jgi:hypothetical protein